VFIYSPQHQIQALPDMHNKQSKTAHPMPMLDLLMAFRPRYRFHFKPKGTLVAKRRKKKWKKN
jgi:hypothetical protein